MSPRFFSEEQEREVAALFTDHRLTQAQIQRQFGCSRPAVVGALKRQGVYEQRIGGKGFGGAPRRPWASADLDEMERRWNAGESKSAIAGHFSTRPSIVDRELRLRGISPHRRERWHMGSDHHHWKGGRSVNAQGYVVLRVDGQSVLEHRHVLAAALGRKLDRIETVHHINGDKSDNRIENLQLRQGRHGKGATFACLDCGSHNVEATPLH